MMHHRLLHRGVAGAASLALANTLLAAKPETRVRAEIPAQYRWDFSAIYSSWDAWESAMKDMEGKMDAFAALKGTLAKGPTAVLKAYQAYDKQPDADVARIYDTYRNGNIFERVPYVLDAAVKSIVKQQVDPRIASDLKNYDFHKVIDNSVVDRLVKEGFFENLFGAGIKAEEQRKAKLAFK